VDVFRHISLIMMFCGPTKKEWTAIFRELYRFQVFTIV